MNTIKANAKIKCEICGCAMKRTKSIKVDAVDKDAAIIEAQARIDAWKKTLIGTNCKVCKSIIAAQ